MWLALPGVEKAEKAELLMGLARAASIRGSHGHSLELAKRLWPYMKNWELRRPPRMLPTATGELVSHFVP